MCTSLALMELSEAITTALDDKKVTVGVFIDLKRHLIQLTITCF